MLKLDETREIVCFDGQIECPHDMAQLDFENFEFEESILDLTLAECSTRFNFGMKEWVESVMPAAIGRPKTILELIEHHLKAEFGNLVGEREGRAIGEAASVTFKEECIIFRREIAED